MERWQVFCMKNVYYFASTLLYRRNMVIYYFKNLIVYYIYPCLVDGNFIFEQRCKSHTWSPLLSAAVSRVYWHPWVAWAEPLGASCQSGSHSLLGLLLELRQGCQSSQNLKIKLLWAVAGTVNHGIVKNEDIPQQ